MRWLMRVLALAVAFAAGAVGAQTLSPCTASCPGRYYWETAPLTRAAPTAAPVAGAVGAGMPLTNVIAARISLCPAAGQTLTGTGNLRAYLWHPSAATWMRSPDLDLAVGTATTSANPCRVWPDSQTGLRTAGNVLYATDTIGVSGGTTVTVRIDGQVAP